MGSNSEHSDMPGPTAPAEPLSAAVDELLDTCLTPLTDDEITDLLRDTETCLRKLATISHRLIVEISQRCIPAEAGCASVNRYLMDTLRLSRQEAGRRVTAANALGQWSTVGGRPAPVTLPHTAAGQAAGEISPEHAARIHTVMKQIPHRVEAADREAAEEVLVRFAATGACDDIGKVGNSILAYLDPDGSLTTERDRQEQRGIIIGDPRANGMSSIRGEITPALRALLDAVCAKMARPGMNNPEDPQSPSGDCAYVDRDAMVAAATRDTRNRAQRQHDALYALLQPGVRVDELGSHRGLPVAAILTMRVEDVENAAGVATTATGGTVPMAQALKLAEHARPFLAVFDHAGMPLHFGQAKRLATPAQRMALIAAVRGCTRPGCDAPASMCATHHIREHAKGGPTDIDNETLACDSCHAKIHDGPGGWKTIVLGKNSRYPGRTAWIAPKHIDPTQTPRINHRHHPDELLANALAHAHTRQQRWRQHE